jgi:metal-dependent amidase/aminoacylase/carboxypeptidase family protein
MPPFRVGVTADPDVVRRIQEGRIDGSIVADDLAKEVKVATIAATNSMLPTNPDVAERGPWLGRNGGNRLVIRIAPPSMVNSEEHTAFAAEVARRVSGNVDVNAPAIMGGEDFAYMLEACPGAYIQIGNGDTPDVHHPKYDFNDEAIPAGASYWAELAEFRLPAHG